MILIAHIGNGKQDIRACMMASGSTGGGICNVGKHIPIHPDRDG
jgi:hypothetical protein